MKLPIYIIIVAVTLVGCNAFDNDRPSVVIDKFIVECEKRIDVTTFEECTRQLIDNSLSKSSNGLNVIEISSNSIPPCWSVFEKRIPINSIDIVKETRTGVYFAIMQVGGKYPIYINVYQHDIRNEEVGIGETAGARGKKWRPGIYVQYTD